MEASNLTDLLPPERRHKEQNVYLLRLGVVAALIATILMVVAAALLVPTYLFLSQEVQSRQAQLARVEAALSAAGGSALSTQLAALTSDTARLSGLKTAPRATAAITEALGVPRTGVTLSGFSYVPPVNGQPGTLVLTGSAATRIALQNYQTALQGSSFAASVNLPVSAYAKDANIPFVVTVTLAP